MHEVLTCPYYTRRSELVTIFIVLLHLIYFSMITIPMITSTKPSKNNNKILIDSFNSRLLLYNEADVIMCHLVTSYLDDFHCTEEVIR